MLSRAQWNPAWSYPMSLIAWRVSSSILSSTDSGPRTSPAITTRLVVASVSQATRDSGIAAM